MVTGNRDFTSSFHEFCSCFRFFSAVGHSLCAAYFLHGKKNGIYFHFFSCWLFSFKLLTLSLSLSLSLFLSLSFAKEKSGIVVKNKG